MRWILLVLVGLALGCGDRETPAGPAGKMAHPWHEGQTAVSNLDLSTDREVMAAVTLDRVDPQIWGYIDKAGKWVLPPGDTYGGTWGRNAEGRWEFVRQYSAFTRAWPFSEGLAAVQDGLSGQIGFIDNAGSWVIQPQFSYRARRLNRFKFSWGLFPYFDNANGRYGFIDETGDWAIEPQFPYVRGFQDRRAAVRHEDGYCSYINPVGAWVLDRPWQWRGCGSFYEGLAAAQDPQRSHLYGYIDRDGEWAIEPQFTYAERFSEGLAEVMLDDEHRAYIDVDGQFVIGPEHILSNWQPSENSRFSDGLAAKRDIDSSRWGYIDQTGAWAIAPQFGEAGAFSEGLAVVEVSGGNWGYIDQIGVWAIDPQFGGARSFTRTTDTTE